ncbi:MAG: hypothetical protein AABW56_01140 [Nanoarchaeota archaeon]
MVDTVQDIEKQLESVIKWTPEFERGYDWDNFYFDNSVFPVVCYGTSSASIERIKEQGINPQGKKSKILQLSESLSSFVLNNKNSLNIAEFNNEKFVIDAERIYLTFSPGIAWCYARMAGENRRNICSYANEVIEHTNELDMSGTDSELIIKIKGQLEVLESEKNNGFPSLVLVQTNLEKFERSGLLAELLDKNSFLSWKNRYEVNNKYPDFSQGMLICANIRYLKQDLSFQISLTDDEIYTTVSIPSEDIVDILTIS